MSEPDGVTRPRPRRSVPGHVTIRHGVLAAPRPVIATSIATSK